MVKARGIVPDPVCYPAPMRNANPRSGAPNAKPCPRCGYARLAPGPCAICESASAPAARPLPSNPARGPAALTAGLLAFPRGVALLFGNRGIKRLMLPPFLITLLLFAGLIWLAGHNLSAALDTALTTADGAAVELTSLDAGWWRSTLEWLLNDAWGAELLMGSSWLLFAVLAVLLAWFTFSLVFELVAGPFLDEIHGLLETRWFGDDPRKARHRPTGLPAKTCAAWSWRLGAIGAALFVLALTQLSGWSLWFAPVALAAPFLAAATPAGLPGTQNGAEYAKWLRWVLADNSKALAAAGFVALFTLVLMVVALPLHLVPVVGSLAYSGIVGFATALGMLDLALERRDLKVAQRLEFAVHHLLPVAAFGAVTGAVFAIPIFGPMLAVPAASIGGLWLVCRLDKGFLARP